MTLCPRIRTDLAREREGAKATGDADGFVTVSVNQLRGKKSDGACPSAQHQSGLTGLGACDGGSRFPFPRWSVRAHPEPSRAARWRYHWGAGRRRRVPAWCQGWHHPLTDQDPHMAHVGLLPFVACACYHTVDLTQRLFALPNNTGHTRVATPRVRMGRPEICSRRLHEPFAHEEGH